MGDLVRISVGDKNIHIIPDPLGFIGKRVFIESNDNWVEIGRVVRSEDTNYLQPPEVEYGLSPEILRAIAGGLDE